MLHKESKIWRVDRNSVGMRIGDPDNLMLHLIHRDLFGFGYAHLARLTAVPFGLDVFNHVNCDAVSPPGESVEACAKSCDPRDVISADVPRPGEDGYSASPMDATAFGPVGDTGAEPGNLLDVMA